MLTKFTERADWPAAKLQVLFTPTASLLDFDADSNARITSRMTQWQSLDTARKVMPSP